LKIGIALLLTLGAGLATTLGSLLGLMIRNPGKRFLSFTLGFSAGVMLLVSFVELLQQSIVSIGFINAHLTFLAGMVTFFIIDFLIPHEYIGQADYRSDSIRSELKTTGILVAVGIAIHNFPEGMATFVSALEDIHLGLAIGIAIAIHNIPEGLAVSVPVYAATGSRKKAFLWSFLSGVTEPFGAVVAALVLMPILTPATLGWMLAGVAGIMVAISLDELIPAAMSFGKEHLPIVGIISGMAVMAFSLWFLRP